LKSKFKYILAAVALLIAQSSLAQESLSGLEINPAIKKLHEKKSTIKAKNSKAILELPFIDDFAKSVGFPDSSLWINEMAFINISYADSAPSIGVATLDAIDENGSIYENEIGLPFGADTLTSKQVNLNYPGNNTIFLSFYYQPGGLGNSPDPKDTLILEFYSPDSSRWETAWEANFYESDSILIENNLMNTSIDTIYGNTIINLKRTFQQVLVPVNQDQFLKGTFQFRFRNYASLSTSKSNESRASNSDHWNLDFIILDKDRNENDTTINDVTIYVPYVSLLKNYESMPWHHYLFAQNTEMKDYLEMHNRNLSSTGKNPFRKFQIIDLSGFTETKEFDGGNTSQIYPFSTQYYDRSLNEPLPYYQTLDSIIFQINAFIESDITPESTPYRWNDTTRFYQIFHNYYAFDDGTSENGYGLIGEGTSNAKVVMRFESFTEDTLAGIQIYFNQVLNNANQYTYKIHVWDEVNGEPGSIIYTLENQKPVNADELNKFTLIPFDEKILIDGAFYIGWQKENTLEMLNVGFDVNRINNDKLFYNFSGEWKQSQYEGTVMIRPMFGDKVEVVTDIEDTPESKLINLSIYPNPVNDELFINTDFQSNLFNYSIFDSFGRMISNGTLSESSIDVSNLNSGMYFIRISSSTKTSTTKKFLIIR
jgi:hypothetical protein